MITDRENTFFDNLLPGASATPFGHVVKINNRQMVPSLRPYVNVETPVNNATSLRLQLVSSAAADLSSPTTMWDTGVVALADFNAARRLVGSLPAVPAAHQYIGFILTVAGTAPTVGGLTAGLAEATTIEDAPRPTYHTGLSA